ncbi:MAG: heparan-alpha-glucosaminide N-acetyltransferase domain-containing protein [Gemmatimonadaceae bacterium]
MTASIAADLRPAVTSQTRDTVRTRVTSVDLVRGIVMILMALDHTRDYFSNLRFQPEDLSKATPFLFATRWITHFCAPTFFLLAGVGAALAVSGGKSKKEISRFLLTRGLWLIFLELTVTALGWNFKLGYPVILLVIWALGLSMVILSGLVWLPQKAVGAIALATIIGHNLLDNVGAASMAGGSPLWHLLHRPGLVSPDPLVIVGYPIIPWFAVMALGFAFGEVFRWQPERRKRFLLIGGAVSIVAFMVIRFLNGYGNPEPWTPQRTGALTVASFLNALKYPPSLDYLLMTLGPAFIALALLENARGPLARAVSVYGRVPMFYYILHLYLIHILAYAFAMWQGGDGNFLSLDVSSFPAWYGTGLPGVYLAWATVVLILYLPCRWFANLKSRRRDRWLSYI